MQDKKARFLKAYSQVPDILKNQIVVMINSKPYTWDSIPEILSVGRSIF